MKRNKKSIILIVDDKPANILVLESLLAAKDRYLIHATSGEDALKTTLHKNVDLIILDVQMPGMDGFEVAQILKLNKRTKDIPIIFATAENKERKFIMKGYDEGAIDYLFKPLDPEIVKAKVTVLLKIQLQRKELTEKNNSLEKSALLINNSADIIGIIDAETFQIDEINNAFMDILGYSREETIHTPLTFFLTNEDRVLIKELSKDKNERLSFETRVYCKDRNIKWLQWKVIVRGGKWFVNARDSTDSKDVEKIRNYLATVVKQSNNAIYIHDSEGKIISWNKGAEKIYGYPEEEALNMKVGNIIPEYVQRETEIIINKIVTGEKIQSFDTKRISKHGKLLDVTFSASLLAETESDDFSIAVTETDITERKFADEQMKESEARFKKLFQNAPYPMWVYDLKSLRFLEVNQTALSSYGYSREEFLSMKITDIRPASDIPRLLEDVNHHTNTTGLWVHQLKNGQLIDVEITSHLLDFQGHKASLVMANNITERKKAEEQIRLLNAELQTNIQQLEITNSELESFSYSVSHDLRAPLRAMNGYSKMLEEDYEFVIDSEGKRLLSNIQLNARKMGNLIDDLLTFSRLGRKEVIKSLINNKELVNDVLIEIKNLTNYCAEIKLSQLPHSYADQALIRQVWLNLLSNAVKYSAKKEKPVIEIGFTKLENEIMFFVKDNGAGLNMQYADKLFGVFQRLHNPNEFEGTGIGLAIVHRIITKHGGRVWAESRINEGATFYFILPDNRKK